MRAVERAILTTLAAGLPIASFGQGFSISKIIDANTLRPDGQGFFQNSHAPSTDGRYVVWAEQAGDYSIWSADLNTLQLTRLADTSTAAPGGSGNFQSFTQAGGGPYAGFNVIVRGGTAVFLGNDTTGNGLYSVPAAGGGVKQIANYNTKLPNGGQLGPPGHAIYAFGVNDSGSVVFTGEAVGNAADGTALGDSVYSASIDGSKLVLIADEDHLFSNPLQALGGANSCVMNFGTVGIGGNSVVFAGAGSGFSGMYTLPVAGPAQGVAPVFCGSGSAGPLVIGSGAPLPGDPAPGKPVSSWDFIQTDGQSTYFHGFDSNYPCCSSASGGWSGIFSVPLSGGAATKIVENGDTLPSIGKVTLVSTMLSVDNGNVVFVAENENASPAQRGIFFYQNGQILKVFASGDTLGGATLTPNGNLEIWPQSLKDGRIAFGWSGGIYVATQIATGFPSISAGGVVPLFNTTPTIQPGAWASIYGANLIPGQVPENWAGDYPMTLGGASVTINGKPAFLSYASPTQINLQAPDDAARGPVVVTLTTPSGSAAATVNLADQSPSFSLLGDGKHVAGIIVRPDGSGAYGSGAGSYDIIGPTGTTTFGYKTVAAKAGDTLVLFGIGFGPTTPPIPAGKPYSGGPAKATASILLTVNNASVTPFFVGAATPGLFQFNMTLPPGLGSGDQPLLAMVNGVPSQSGVVIALQ